MRRVADAKSSKRTAVLSMLLVCTVMGVLAPTAKAQNVSFKPVSGSPFGVGSAPVGVAVGDFDGDDLADIAVANANDNTVSILRGDGHGGFSLSGTFTVNTNPFSVIPPRTCITGCSSVPLAIATGDFNNDGVLDLAVTNIPINDQCKLSAGIFGNVCSQVAILLGDKQHPGAFLSPNNFDTGGNIPIAITVANFSKDKDSNLDWAVANLNSNNVEIFLGDGHGGVSSNSSITVGTRPTALASGDFNGDGKPDLAVADADDGTISVALGNGDGTFQAPVTFRVGGRPSSIAVVDLNGDGKADLVVANLLSSNVSVLLGDGTGSFAAAVNYPVGRYPSSVAVGDFNSDGKADIGVVSRLSDVVSILLGNGDGTFAIGKHFGTGNKPLSLAAIDFNGDGVPDLVVANAADNTVSVLVDNTDITPPTTTATASPGPNGNGWNDTTVSVSLSAADNPGGSGVKEVHYTIGSGTPVVVAGSSATIDFTTEGIFALTYFAVDNAGNVEGAHSLTIRIDLTPPAITSSQSPAANGAGWNNSNVTVSFSCADALSGVDTCTTPILVSSEGAGQVETGTATDKAGNNATTSRTINLDKTPPVLTMPTLAASYLLNSSLTLTFGATDALSGLATMQATLNGVPITSGSTVTLTHLATNTFTLTATDVAGNTSTQTATFAVVYNFIGFLPPIPNDGSGLFKLGSTVPVKFQLTDAKGTIVSTAVARLTIQMISGTTLLGTPIDATASGSADVGDLFRFDTTQYIFNWSTKGVSTGTWQLQARLDDGTVHTVVMGTK
jgi:FG-GAP-like repeat